MSKTNVAPLSPLGEKRGRGAHPYFGDSLIPAFCRVLPYRGTSLKINNPSLEPYSRLMPRALWWS